MNYTDMQALGCELSADMIYNEDQPSVEDGIVRLNGGQCTAEMISAQGLMLTNHHCAYDAIASLSSETNDLLTDGFWSASMEEELPIEGATAAFLIRSENITQMVEGRGELNPFEIEELLDSIATAAVAGTGYDAEAKPMFHGGEYYLFVYEVYRDVRLVGAPPSAIGKFGYDQDNWMWPRHTGDFSLLRVYAGPDNKPATYSPDNKPYQPKHFFPISLGGVDSADFAMILGYPGSTERYLTSAAVKMALENSNLHKIKIMGAQTDIMKAAMDQSDAVRIKLASNYASLMNSYKYFIGQTTMLERYDIAGKKAEEEMAYQAWVDADPDRQEKYGTVLKDIARLHDLYVTTDKFMNYLLYGMLSPDAMGFSYAQLNGLQSALNAGDEEMLAATIEEVQAEMGEHFDNFVYEVDRDVFAATLVLFYQEIPASLHPPMLKQIAEGEVADVAEDGGKKKKKKKKPMPEMVQLSPEERIRQWAVQAYSTSYATSRERLEALLANPQPKALDNDPLLNFVSDALGFYRDRVALSYYTFDFQVEALSKTYIQGLKEKHPEKKFYPDANSTMRLTYGRVLPYEPRDAVTYDYYTTIEGIMEKDSPTDPDFFVPEKLRALYQARDYGRYAAPDGGMRVCFLTTNDITGGNSGSPVLNARGELVGCAFDGNWEAMAGDIYVFPNLNRTIAVDARYVLFIIEKYAGATRLIEEMKIVE
ncbi:MAG: S46 family peptidase [Bacteroidia bacterium]